jgi:folate-dependent phosphoribosylglycinamide formyltransferase PurN
MKLLWIGGSHPRHLHYINTIAKAFPLSGAIIEIRENLLPQPPEGLAETDRQNFIRHFGNREKAEQKYFGEQPFPDCPARKVTHATLNTPESVDFVRSVNPDLVLVFGSGMVRDPLFSALTQPTVNLHLGLSPRYRGAATLFWPFYFLEPPYAGSTFHFIVSEPDAGEIIHQVTPELHPDDGIHDVACKVVMQSAQDAVRLLEIYAEKGGWVTRKQKATGKNFLASDFIPEHLRVIYNVYNDDMVRQYLDGRLKCKTPSPYRQF